MAASRRIKEPETRRNDLITAARKVFSTKGVACSAVSDIVKAAGVAQGTFYLYFKAKNDIVNAVAEQMADEMVEVIEKSVTARNSGAIGSLLALRDAILALLSEKAGRELTEIYHRPENRAVHDRMADRLLPRLAPLVERLVQQGVAEGVFMVEDPQVAAWFVMGGLHALELGFTDRSKFQSAIVHATNNALRALGYAGPLKGSGRLSPGF
ncbi:TetR/AcrR family transcriptional regulator [candidate division FCPU426 bacterium]|nr:TetR/AcrR family transcriptional regulator [candidate division FCPU426 bacterium]